MSVLKFNDNWCFLIDFCSKLTLWQLGFDTCLRDWAWANMRVLFKLRCGRGTIDTVVIVGDCRCVVDNIVFGSLLLLAPWATASLLSHWLLHCTSDKIALGCHPTELRCCCLLDRLGLWHFLFLLNIIPVVAISTLLRIIPLRLRSSLFYFSYLLCDNRHIFLRIQRFSGLRLSLLCLLWRFLWIFFWLLRRFLRLDYYGLLITWAGIRHFRTLFLLRFYSFLCFLLFLFFLLIIWDFLLRLLDLSFAHRAKNAY